jgi:hypothetical protein
LTREVDDLVVVDQAAAGTDAVVHNLEPLAAEVHGCAVARAATSVESIERIVLPGSMTACSTAWLAWLRECDCTFARRQPKG